MSASSAFSDEKGGSSSVGEPEYGHDPASGGIFSSDYKRYGLGGCVDAVPRWSGEALSVVLLWEGEVQWGGAFLAAEMHRKCVSLGYMVQPTERQVSAHTHTLCSWIIACMTRLLLTTVALLTSGCLL